MVETEIDEFTKAYIEAALWSSLDESDERGGEPMDLNYGITDIAPVALADMISDCRRFQESNAADIEAGPTLKTGCTGVEYAGHDFWLTRSGHGCGFWDGDWPEEAGERLTKAAEAAGSRDLYVGDDGLIYHS